MPVSVQDIKQDPLGILVSPSKTEQSDPLGILEKKSPIGTPSQPTLQNTTTSTANGTQPTSQLPLQSSSVDNMDAFHLKIPSIQDAIDNQKNQGTTSVNKNTEVDEGKALELGKQHQQRVQDAIDNTTQKVIQNKGFTDIKKGSLFYNGIRQDIADKVKNGDATLSFDKDGTPGLKRTVGFWEGIGKGWNNATQDAQDAHDFVNAMTLQQKVDYAKKQAQDNPPSEYIGEKNSTGGSVGNFLGSAAPLLTKYATGAVEGAGIAALAPETGGASLEGLPAVAAMITTTPDAMNQGSRDEQIRAFNEIKKEHPEMDDILAMDQASKRSTVGAIAGGLTNALLTGESGEHLKLPLSEESKNVVGNAIGDVLKTSVHMGTTSGAITALKEEEGKSDGLNTPTSDIVNDAVKSAKDNASTAFLLTGLTHAAMGVLNMPHLVENAYKYGIVKSGVPLEEVQTQLENNEKLGNIPQGTATKITSDLASYKEALDKTPNNLPPDAKAQTAGLIQKAINLEQEIKTVHPSAAEDLKSQLDAVNKQIADVSKTGNHLAVENNEISGKPYQEEINEHPIISSPKIETNASETSNEANAPNETEGRQEVVNNGAETTAGTAPISEKLVSNTIEPTEAFRTLNYGDYVDKPESKESQEEIKQQVLSNEPIGKTGERFTDFINRVVPAFKNILDKEENNTAVVTHSSVIKALEVWNEMGKPDVDKLTPEQTKEFAEKYVAEKIAPEGSVTTIKGEDGKEVHILRHGETEDNKLSEFRNNDTQLTDKGESQAKKAGQELKQVTGGDVPKIITSDLPRTIHTSNIIHNELDVHKNFDKEGEPILKPVPGVPSSFGQIRINKSKEGYYGVVETEIDLGGKWKANPSAHIDVGDSSPSKFFTTAEGARKYSENKIIDKYKEVNKQGAQPTEEGDKNTGIKKAITLEERGQRKLSPIALKKLGTDSEVLQKGKEDVDSGKINPRDVVNRVIKENGIYSPDEAGAMQYYAHQLAGEEHSIRDEISNAPKDSDERLNGVDKLQQLSDEVDDFTKANRINSRSWGQLGNVMQIESDQSFSPSLNRTVIKENYGGEIPKDVQAKLDEALKMRDLAIEELKKAKEDAAAKSIKNDATLEQRQTKRKVTKEELKKERDDLLNEFKKKDDSAPFQNSTSPLTDKQVQILGKLAINYFKDGVVTIEGLADKIYNDVKDKIDGVTKAHIKDAISNYPALKEVAKQKEIERLGRKEKDVNSQLETGKLKEPSKPSDIVFKKTNDMIKAEQRIAKAEFQIKKLKQESFESKKNMYQKALGWAGRLVRLSVLSGTSVLYKLSSAAVIGGAIKRIPEQVLGGMYSKIFKGIADKAPIEGYLNAKSEAQFYKEFFNPKKFADNSAQILKTGESRLSQKFNPDAHEHIPLLYLPTDLHQIIKDPLKRGAYEASFRNAMINVEKHGYDIKDPLVVNSIENAAYKRSNYEIFQESNALSRKFGQWKNEMEKNGNVGATGKFVADFLIPVSTVPTNIARRLGITSPFGLIKASADVINSYRKGIENLKPEEADQVMRQLKQGSLGTALWLTGWFGYKSLGGLYTSFNPNKKRMDDLKSDQMLVDGKMIPKPVQHALPIEITQLAATARRIWEERSEKKNNTFERIAHTGLATIGAATSDIPIISTGTHLVEATQNTQGAKKLGKDMQSRFEPTILKETGVIKPDKKK